jgi:hypothetical protein
LIYITCNQPQNTITTIVNSKKHHISIQFHSEPYADDAMFQLQGFRTNITKDDILHHLGTFYTIPVVDYNEGKYNRIYLAVIDQWLCVIRVDGNIVLDHSPIYDLQRDVELNDTHEIIWILRDNESAFTRDFSKLTEVYPIKLTPDKEPVVIDLP